MLNVWLGCQLHILNAPSWYLAVLIWFWLIFPYLHPLITPVFRHHPWPKMVLVNCMATASVYLFNDYGYFTFSMLPPLRVWEFIIGCAAATTIDQRVHWAWPLSVALGLTAYYVLCFYVFTHQTEQCYNQVDMACAFWQAQPLKEASDPCITKWTGQYLNKTAVFWAVLIQWVAASEHLNISNGSSRWLENSTTLKELSKFSLHLYLGHGPLSSLVRAVVGYTDFHNPWQMDILMLVVYFLCYLLYKYVQPALEWCANNRCVQPALEWCAKKIRHSDPTACDSGGHEPPPEPQGDGEGSGGCLPGLPSCPERPAMWGHHNPVCPPHPHLFL
jgi:peptidoglycan/LPS O-acetylase OafA/YrhL